MKIIVKIDVGNIDNIGGPYALVKEAAAAAAGDFSKDVWFARADNGKISVDDSLLEVSRADDSFYAFEYVGVE